MGETEELQSVPSPQARFCKRCGAELVAAASHSTLSCPACAERGAASAPGPAASPEPRQRPLRTAIGLYLALLGTSVVGLVLARTEVSEFALEAGILIADAVLVTFVAVARWRDVRLALLQPISARWLGLSVALGVLSFGFASAVIGFAHAQLGMPVISYSDSILEAGHGWSMVMLMVCVQPTLFEELAFRGIIFSALRPLLSRTEVVVVSALLFMALHILPASFPHTLLVGLVAGFLRVRTGSLLPGMALHFSHNTLCVLEEAWTCVE